MKNYVAWRDAALEAATKATEAHESIEISTFDIRTSTEVSISISYSILNYSRKRCRCLGWMMISNLTRRLGECFKAQQWLDCQLAFRLGSNGQRALWSFDHKLSACLAW